MMSGQENGKSEQESLGHVTSEFLGSTSAHGLPHITSNRSLFRKIIWMIIFLGAFSYLIYYAYGLFESFLKRDVAVKTTVHRENILTFPAVTLCNNNILRKSMLSNSKYASLQNVDHNKQNIAEDSSNTRRKREIKQELFGQLSFLNAYKPLPVDQNKMEDLAIISDDDYFMKRESHHEKAITQDHRNKRFADYGSGDDEYNDYNYVSYYDYEEDYDDGNSNQDSDKQVSEFGIVRNPDCNLPNPDLCDIEPNNFEQLITASKTSDYSDLLETFRPTWDDLDEYGYKAKQMIQQCSFDGSPCTYKDFDVVRNSEQGNCFVFNSVIYNTKRKARRTNKSGSRNGLKLTLYIGKEEDYIGLFAHERGVRVTVHSPFIHSYPNDHGVSAAPHFRTQIGAKKVVMKRLPEPYTSNCTKEHSRELDVRGNYSVLACRETCLRRNIFTRCGCYNKALKAKDSPLCDQNHGSCVVNVTAEFDREELGCHCRPACHEETYDLSLSLAKWPSEPYQYYLYEQSQEEKWTKENDIGKVISNVVRIQVYIGQKDVVTIEEFPAYPWDRLVADIGGILGLFLGISVCTAIEVMEYLLDIIIFLCLRHKHNTQNRKKVEPDNMKNNYQMEPADIKYKDDSSSGVTESRVVMQTPVDTFIPDENVEEDKNQKAALDPSPEPNHTEKTGLV